MTSPEAVVQSDLRFLLPAQSGERAVILGDSPPLVQALQADGVETIGLSPQTWLTRDRRASGSEVESSSPKPFVRGADHVLIPEWSWPFSGEVLAEVSRLLRPGGWLVLAVHNAEALHRLRLRKHRSRAGHAVGLRACCRRLWSSGFRVIGKYGVHEDLRHPQYLVPLERRAIARYFFDAVFLPFTREGEAGRRAAVVLAAAGLQRVLFRDLAVLAQWAPMAAA